ELALCVSEREGGSCQLHSYHSWKKCSFFFFIGTNSPMVDQDHADHAIPMVDLLADFETGKERFGGIALHLAVVLLGGMFSKTNGTGRSLYEKLNQLTPGPIQSIERECFYWLLLEQKEPANL
ncbi:hypothetical protein CEXT_267511, partial [Caerostris extrusa]